MANDPDEALREQTRESLERMQTFDVNSLPREDELGRDLNFLEAVPRAKRLIGLYNQVAITALENFPGQQLQVIKKQADSDFTRFKEIIDFTTNQANPHEIRKSLIDQLEQAYQPSFVVLHPLISYSVSKSADVQRLENEARAMIQGVRDEAAKLTQELEENKKQATTVLEEIRKVAAEQGVSQQALYFKEEAETHDALAETWRKRTFTVAWILGGYAILSVLIHKIPWIAPSDTYQTVQLGISKVLIFAVISYMLYLSARNYLAHKHNAIVNKHRQNALMTYRALVDAAKDADNQGVILTHASACVFGPQSTGYSREGSGSAPTAKSVIELLNKPFSPDE